MTDIGKWAIDHQEDLIEQYGKLLDFSDVPEGYVKDKCEDGEIEIDTLTCYDEEYILECYREDLDIDDVPDDYISDRYDDYIDNLESEDGCARYHAWRDEQ